MRFHKQHEAEWLPIWASVGLAVLLCGPWFIQSSKFYHQILMITLWLPALIALIMRSEIRQLLALPEAYLFVALSLWTYIVLFVSGGADVSSDAKLPIYVFLSLVGVWLSGRQRAGCFERVLFGCAVLGGYLAGMSWVKFYLVDGHELSQRLIAIGLWDKVILAGHAVSALAVLFFCLAPRCSNPSWLVVFVPAGLGYLLFLGFCQTRGVWIALAAGMLIYIFVSSGKWTLMALGAIMFGSAIVWLFKPELLLQRGLSYRPVIWEKGLELLKQNWSFGVGFNEFSITGSGLGSLTFKHPHNLFLNEGIRLGAFGLLLFVLLWLAVGWRGWCCRQVPLGRATLTLWVVASIALMTDGIGLWKKPYADWLITWVPIALALVLEMHTDARTQPVKAPHGTGVTRQPKRTPN
jgi:O-antigen ligase